MRRITIENLGPIAGQFEMSLDKKLTILIGEQATGKSTIARAVYYCIICVLNEINIRCYQENDLLKNHFDAVQYFLRRNYERGKIKLNHHDLELNFDVLRGNTVDIPEKSPMDFRNYEGEQAIYIPAGRSLISLLFESYAAAKTVRVDPFFDEYLLLLDSFRRNFPYPMENMIYKTSNNRTHQENEAIGKYAINITKKILKGEYYCSDGLESLFHDYSEAAIPLISASSGQQEIIYILLTLLYVMFNPKPYTIIIEEPEAHLYPASQKLFMELVAHVINTTGSRVIITTHSPYILTSTNLLIHSAKVENEINDEKAVIDKMSRLNPDEVSAYMLERNGKFSYRNIIDEETGFIESEEIDTVSDLIDKSMSDLIELEVKHGL